MKKIYIILITTLILISSCSKFLDIQPTGTLIDEKQFSDIQGYYDTMYGAYGSMATPELYGGELSYSFLDKIGAQFCNNTLVKSIDPYIVIYDYKNENVAKLIDNIWLNQYKTISFVNNILKHLEKPSFSHSDFPIIKGEALALRAFLHFDILRLFADSYTTVQKPEDVRGIPYSYTFDIQNKKLFNLKESYDNIIKDLKEAESLLKEDKKVEIEFKTSDNYHEGRAAHMNLYAVKATLARVYYSMGNLTEAAKYAKDVIESENFQLSTPAELYKGIRFPFLDVKTKELIFGLHNRKIGNNVIQTFLSRYLIEGDFTQARKDIKELYDLSTASATSTDVRFSLFYKEVEESKKLYRFIRLVKDEEDLKTTPLQGLNLITLPEMYYILIEATYDTNKEEALVLLNKLRQSRGLAPLSETFGKEKYDTKEHLEQELMRDKMREFPGMGHIFYALKHYNRDFTSYDKKPIKASKEVFVLPWPENELEYGNK